MKEIRGADRVSRTTRAMLSVPVRYAPCPGQLGDSSWAPCGAPVPAFPDGWQEVGAKVAAAAEGQADPDALHAAALLDLLSGGRGNSLDRSISYLEMTTRLDPTADRFIDLSAALLERAARDSDARSSIAALDAAAHATRLDSGRTAAHFNLALALRDVGLLELARREFAKARESEPEAGWADESAALQAAIVVDTVFIPSDSMITPDSMATFASRHSNEGRALAWERLAAWGRAHRRADAAESERNLRLAEAAGAAIAEHHVDRSVADAAAAIRAADEAERVTLATAHIALVEGQQLARSSRAAAAESAFTRAAQIGSRSPALAGWGQYSAGNNRLALNDRRGAEQAMRKVLASPAAARYPALAARAQWVLGVVLVRNGQPRDAATAIAASRDLYRQLGEREFLAAMTGQLGEIVNLVGDSREAYGLLRDAMQMLRDYPLSNWRHNVMLVMSRAAAADGFPAAAEAIDAEDELASRAAKRVPALVESEITRAQRTLGLRDTAGARRAVTEGRRLATQLPVGNVRQQLESDLAVASANLGGAPDRESAALDSAIGYFGTIQNSIKELRAYAARSSLRWRARDLAGADADLDKALSIYESRRDNVTDPTQRSLLGRQARVVGDALAMLRLSRNDAPGALLARERSRTSRAPIDIQAPESRLALDFSVIGDTVVIFAVRGSRLVASVLAGEASTVVRDAELASLALERESPERAWRPPLERLYTRLITPVIAHVLPSDTVVTIIAGGALGRVPFAALRNPADGSYLIDRHALRFASSLRQASAPRSRLSEQPRVVLVADPVVDRRAFPGLAPLPNAIAEVDSIAPVLTQVHVLRGAEADTASLKQALARAEVFHFAGHALFDDTRPQRSQLVTGAQGLTAESIAGMRLPSLQLVVLSACETTRSSLGAGAGFLGLTESFIAAGAQGAVGSTWKVGDDPTRRLMQAFYGSLARTRDPVIALRDAQLSMREASPAEWAAFRYAGH